MKERIKEHKADINFCRPCTALPGLNFNQNIIIDFDQSKLMYPASNYYAFIGRKSIEILR